MASDLEQQIIPPAYDGIDSDSAPDTIPATKAPRISNMLVDSPGKLTMRGPIDSSPIVLESYPANIPIGTWTDPTGAVGGAVLVGYKAGTAGIDPWVAPFAPWSAVDSDYARAATVATYVTLRDGRATRITVTRDTAPGPRSTVLGEYTYGPAFDSSGSLVTSGQSYRPRKLLKWGGGATAPTVVANAPDVCQDAIAHLNRLWVLGGRDIPSGATNPPVERNTLYYSVTGGPQARDDSSGLTPESAASWKDFDAITGSRPRTNKIVVGSDTEDFGVGLATVGQTLVIFKRRSMWLLSGYDPSNFTVRQFSDAVGCVDARSIVQWSDGVFFMSDRGFMYFDGAQLVNVTAGMRRAIVEPVLDTVGGFSPPLNSFAVATRLPNDYIALCIGVLPNDVRWCGFFHVPRRAWVEFSSDAIPNRRPIAFGRANTWPFMVAGGIIVKADYVTAPDIAPPGSVGVDRLDVMFTWSEDPAQTRFSGPDGSLMNMQTGVSMFTDEDGQVAAIPARWQSRLFPLTSPFYKSQLHRVLVEYNAKMLDGADGQASWTVTVQNGDGANLADPYDVPGQGNPTRYPKRRVHVQDVFSEANDAQVIVEWRQPPQPLTSAEILSVAVEYQTTRQRRNE